jgi:hypothetical protein
MILADILRLTPSACIANCGKREATWAHGLSGSPGLYDYRLLELKERKVTCMDPTSEYIVSLLLQERMCSSDWLVIRGHNLALLANDLENNNLLILAALETRNAIEQLWFDILLVLHRGSIELDFVEGIRRRRDGFLGAIRQAAPEYRKLVRFSSMCMHLDSRKPVEIIAWDLRRLKKWWQRLSSYCHAQAEPINTLNNCAWRLAAIELIGEVFNYFKLEMTRGATGIMRIDDMKPNTRVIWDDFVAGAIDEEQALIRLQIVNPNWKK